MDMEKNICNLHGKIERKFLNAIALIDRDKSIPLATRENVKSILNEGIQIVRLAINRGKAMEKKLVQYRRAMESCGFRREKNGEILPKQ
jgi:hypothetical protein